MWGVLWWSGHSHSYVFVWPLTGLHLALVLGDWSRPRDRAMQLAAGTAGILTAGHLVGLPVWIAAIFSTAHCSEVWLAGTVLSRYVTTFEDLKRRKEVVLFCALATAVPMVPGVLVTIPVTILTYPALHVSLRTLQPLLVTAATTTLADLVGIAVMTPALLFLVSASPRSLSRLRPHLRTGIPGALVFIAVTVLVFSQNSNPILFLIFPAMVLTLFFFGLEGATFVTVTVTVIGCWQTARGRGPIWLIRGAAMEHRVLVLQLFLWTLAAVALPIGALLDERRRAELSASENQTIYRTLLDNSDDMIELLVMDGSRRYVSPAVQQVTGWTPEEYLALDHLGSIHPEDREYANTVLECFAQGRITQTFRYRLLRKEGGHRWVEASARGYFGPDTEVMIGYVATVRDISELKRQEDRWTAEKAALSHENETLADLAATDELTRIPNRRTFNEAIEYEAARHARSAQCLSLLMVDVDHFKLYNDVYGHQAGDDCLQQLARTLQGSVGRASDVVARVGGEEFAVLLPGTDAAGARRVAEEILQRVRALGLLHEKSPHEVVSVSIGTATWPPYFVTEVAELIQAADRALYQTKSLGRNGITVSTAFSHAVGTSPAAASSAVDLKQATS